MKNTDWISKMPGSLSVDQRNILDWLRENPGDSEDDFKRIFGARDFLYLKDNLFIRVSRGKVYVSK